MAKKKKAAPRRPRYKAPTDCKDVSSILSDVGSSVVKEYAARQPVEIKLTGDQVKAIREGLKGLDARQPTEITFKVSGRASVNLKVAGYWYAGSTCCV